MRHAPSGWSETSKANDDFAAIYAGRRNSYCLAHGQPAVAYRVLWFSIADPTGAVQECPPEWMYPTGFKSVFCAELVVAGKPASVKCANSALDVLLRLAGAPSRLCGVRMVGPARLERRPAKKAGDVHPPTTALLSADHVEPRSFSVAARCASDRSRWSRGVGRSSRRC